MRTLLIGFGVLALALAANVRTGSAQRGYDNKWCISEGLHGGGSLDCTYSTFQQCLASKSGNGGTCYENPYPGTDRGAQMSGRRQRSNQGNGY
jgi:hypothetical protein